MAKEAARKIMEVWEKNIRPCDYIDKETFENVIRYMMAGRQHQQPYACSAAARQMDVDIVPETFDEISREIPVLSTIYPNHPSYTMEEFDAAGGLPGVVKELIIGGKLNPDSKGACSALSAREGRKPLTTSIITLSTRSMILFSIMAALPSSRATSALTAQSSSSAPSIPTSGSSRDRQSAMTVRTTLGQHCSRTIVPGDVVVIRYEGPKGSPGMPHMETFMAAVLGKKMGTKIALCLRRPFQRRDRRPCHRPRQPRGL